jgi:hypothetical protein
LSQQTPRPDRLALGVLGILAVSTLARLWLAAHFYGFLSGDDVEIVQTAAKYALGLEYEPWTLRCLFQPLVLVAPILRIAGQPLAEPLVIAWLASLPTILAVSATTWLVFRLALRLGLSRAAGALAAFFYAFHWLPFGYGSTQYPRPISTMFFVLALLLAVRPETRGVLFGGLLIGAAFAVRFSEAALAIPFLLAVWWRHRTWPALALAAAGGFLGCLLFVGVTDALTWGSPFFSFAEFFRIMHGDARPDAPHADKPWFWYGTSVLQWAGPAAVLLAAVGIRRPAARAPALALGLIVIAESVFAFKQYRYVLAAVPMLALLMAIGCESLLSAGRRGLRAAGWVLLVLAPLWGIERTVSLLRGTSRPAVDAALWMKTLGPRRVLLEQEWAYGGRLTFGNGVEIRDVEPRNPIGLTGPELNGVDAAAFYERDLGTADRDSLSRAGLRQALLVEGPPKTVVVFTRSP